MIVKLSSKLLVRCLVDHMEGKAALLTNRVKTSPRTLGGSILTNARRVDVYGIELGADRTINVSHHRQGPLENRTPSERVSYDSAESSMPLTTDRTTIASDKTGFIGMRLLLSRALPGDRKSTRLNSSHSGESRMPSSA